MRLLWIGLFVLLATTAAQAETKSDSLARAKEEYRRGTQQYDVGNYVDAATHYKIAFELSDRPAFLFNMAQAYRLGKKYEEAIAAYRGFVRRIPESPQRAEASRYIDELTKRVEEDARAEREARERLLAPVVAPPATPIVTAQVEAPTPIERRPKRWVWGIVGASTVVVVGLAIGLGVGLTRPKDVHVPGDVPRAGAF